MKEISFRCDNCGAFIVPDGGKIVKCDFCGSVYEFQEAENDFKTEEVKHYELKADYLDIIRSACAKYPAKTSYLVMGEDVPGSKKRDKAIKNFAVPDEEIFYIFDTTILGTCRNGYALAASGLYFKDSNNRSGKLSWDEFANARISKEGCFDHVDVFELNHGTNARSLIDFLTQLRNSIRQ